MAAEPYQYVLSLFKEDGTSLGASLLDPDFEPAREWAFWVGVRKGLIPADRWDGAAVAPLWHGTQGPPYLSGFRVSVEADGRRADTDFGISYFEPLARQASAGPAEDGRLELGESFRYLVTARRRPPDGAPPGRTPRFHVDSDCQPLRLQKRAGLEALLSRATAHGTAADQDAPVFVRADLLEETAQLASRTRPNETGGVLIGHLCQDAASPEVYLAVTAQVPARHTQPGPARLTFTAQTWTAVRSAIDIRGRGEIMLGWWHSHCFTTESCKDCERRREGTCAVSMAFMSADDVALHRTVFPRAYNVALVVAESPCGGLEHAMFGWRGGLVASRGYHLLDGLDREPVDTGARDHADAR